MEPVADGCPIGILVDIDLQTKALNHVKGNEVQASIKNKEENSSAVADSSHPWHRNCFLDQTPPKPKTLLKKGFFTPKSNWKTPSPKSMKIISRDASRIVDRLHSSPINCSEVMICDEVFPVMKSLDDAYFDEFHVESQMPPPALEITIPYEKVDYDGTNSFDLEKCTNSTVTNCSSESEVVSEEKISTKLPSHLELTKEYNSISEKTMNSLNSETALTQISSAKSEVSDKSKENNVTCENTSVAVPECMKELNSQPLAPEPEVPTEKMQVVKSSGLKKSMKYFSENNEGNVLQTKGARLTKYLPRFSKTDTSIENRLKETNAGRKQSLNNSMLEQSTKYIAAKHSVLERKNTKENQNLEHHFSETKIEKPKALQRKSIIGRTQSLFIKKDPLCKTETSLGTPKVEPAIRRFHSFHNGATRNAVPTVEKKIVPTTESSSRVLKPKMALNKPSCNGNGFSTPLQFQRSSQNYKFAGSSSANPMRKSLAFNSNQSLIASGIKAPTQKDNLSISKKSTATSSSKLGFGKNLNKLPSLQQFKKDSLPRKLFP